MEFIPSSFYVIFQNHRDRSVEFTVKCVFLSAEDKRRLCRALDHYGICYDFTTLMDELPF